MGNLSLVDESKVNTTLAVGGMRLLNALWRSHDKVHQIGVLNPQSRAFINTPVKNATDALTQALALSASGQNTYVACSEYLTSVSRKADNVAGAYAFWADVDCGVNKGSTGKGYATLNEGKAAVKKFRSEAGLPKPTHVVESGTGLHVYWALDDFVERETWKEYAAKLKTIAKNLGFLADPTRTADCASVLRIPGTFNQKYEPPCPVTLVFEEKSFIANAAMFQSINAAFDKLSEVQTPSAVVAVIPADNASVGAMAEPSSYGSPDLSELTSALKMLTPDCDEYTWKFHRIAPMARVAREHPELANEVQALAKSWSSGELCGIASKAWVTPGQSNGLTGAQTFESQWKRFLQPNPSGKQSSLGSIYFHAKELGWTSGGHSMPLACAMSPMTAPDTPIDTSGRCGAVARVTLPESLQVSSASPSLPAAVSPAVISQQTSALPITLPQVVTPKIEAETIARLAILKPMDYDRARKQAAKALGIQVKTLDQQIKDQRATSVPSELLPFSEVVPWSEAIDPATLFDEIHDVILRYVVMEPEQAVTVTLWTILTWLVDEVDVLPLLIFNAPEKECGKSQGLTLVGKLAARPLSVANSTPSFVFRSIAHWKPTLLIDEADTFSKNNDDLKGLINAGHTRSNAYVGRTVAVGDGHEPVLFIVWCAKCFAGIKMQNHFPAATMSRSHVINMRRKLPHEKVERLRTAPTELFEILSAKLARFATDYAEQVQGARPLLPEELGDRQQDNWEPLLAIAQCAGADWLQRATQAALAMSKPDDVTEGGSNELLADIQEIFQQKRTFKISTVDLIEALVNDLEKAWATYNRGKPLTPRQLAKQLAAYGITPKTVRMAHGTPKGYDAEQFADAFARYLATPEKLPQKGNAATPSAPTPVPTPSANVAYTVQHDDPGGLDAFLAELECDAPDAQTDECGGVVDTTDDTAPIADQSTEY